MSGDWRRPGWSNPAAWYTLAGFVLLGVSLWMPWLAASRTARVELRGDELAAALCDAAGEVAGTVGIDALDEGDRRVLLARFLMRAACRGAYVADIERLEPAPAGIVLALRNRHYAFQVTASPPAANERSGPRAVDAYEVTAWPLRRGGPAHCAFFYPENAARAYTRNLRASYAGFDGRPAPGSSHRRQDADRNPTNYSSFDGELWIQY